MFSPRLQWGKRKCAVYGEGEVLPPPKEERRPRGDAVAAGPYGITSPLPPCLELLGDVVDT
jgi:hypothetical protein